MRSTETLEFHTEMLESREMLAGNVTAEIRGDDLSIRGDNASNVLTISYSPNGVRLTPSPGTTVNGSSFSRTFNYSDDLRIDMGDGNDTLYVGSSGGGRIVVNDDLTIKLGRGRDYVSLQNVQIDDDLTVDMGSGSFDQFWMSWSWVGDDMSVRASGDASSINFSVSTVRDDLKLTGTNGNDNITVRTVRVNDDASISSRGGADSIVVGRFNNQFGSSYVGDDLRIQSGSGNDNVTLHELIVGDRTSISTQSGNDRFRWTGSLSWAYDDISISMGSGYDSGWVSIPMSSDVDIRWSGREA